jgi:hypothetical protein
MANEVKLEVYTIRVRESRTKDKFLPIDSFFDGTDFLKFFQDYISSFDHQLEINDTQKRSLKLDSSKLSLMTTDRIISGIIESGDYGYESTIYDTGSGEERYKRQVEDTEIKPFYFLLYLPRDENKGFVILQRFGIYGIHSIFRNHLDSFFKTKYSNLQLDFNPFVSQQLARKFIENGGIRELTLIRHNLPTDIADRLGMSGHEEDIMSIELKIKSRRNRFLPLNNRVKRFIENPNARMFEVRELDNLGFDGSHKSKINVRLGNNNRTIDLSDTMQLRPYYDIDAKVEKDASGHPKFSSIDLIAKDFITDLQKEVGL